MTHRTPDGPRVKALKARGNGAKNHRSSILVEAKQLLKTMHYNLPNVDTMQRREGAWAAMRQAALNMIRQFCKARSNGEMRLMYIDEMVGEMGVIDAMFDELCQIGALTDKAKLQIAFHMDRMDRGIMLWRDANGGHRNYTNQVREEVDNPHGL